MCIAMLIVIFFSIVCITNWIRDLNIILVKLPSHYLRVTFAGFCVKGVAIAQIQSNMLM